MSINEVTTKTPDISGASFEDDVRTIKLKLSEAVLNGATAVSYNEEWVAPFQGYAARINDTVPYRTIPSITPSFISKLVLPAVSTSLQAKNITVSTASFSPFRSRNDEGIVGSHTDSVIGQGVSLLFPYQGSDATFAFSEEPFQGLAEEVESLPGVSQLEYGPGRFIMLRQRIYAQMPNGEYRDYLRVHHHGRSDQSRKLLIFDFHTSKITQLADLV